MLMNSQGITYWNARNGVELTKQQDAFLDSLKPGSQVGTSAFEKTLLVPGWGMSGVGKGWRKGATGRGWGAYSSPAPSTVAAQGQAAVHLSPGQGMEWTGRSFWTQ